MHHVTVRFRAPLALCALLVTAACAGRPAAETAPAPVHVDPVGVYDLAVDMDGMVIDATIAIEHDGRQGWHGTVESDAGPATVVGVQVDGRKIRFTIPEAEADVELCIHERGLHGKMTGGMGEAEITGSRRM